MSVTQSAKYKILFPNDKYGKIEVVYDDGGRERIQSSEPYNGNGTWRDSLFMPHDNFYILFKLNNFLSEDDLVDFGTGSAEKSNRGTVVSYLYDAVDIIRDGSDIFCKIKFQFFDDKSPITIRDRTPSYNPVTIFSRHEPIQMWAQGGEIQVDLNLKYVAVDPYKYNELWVERMAALFKALGQPNYPGGAAYKAPPVLRLKIGDLIDDLPVIMSSFTRTFEERQFLSPSNFRKSGVINNISDEGPYNFVRAESINGKKDKQMSTPDKAVNGVFLPKMQTFQLKFTSSYPLKTQVDFMVAAKREECARMLKEIKEDVKKSVK